MISKKIIDYLRDEYDSGMTQDEIAKKHNVRQGQIQRILSGQGDAYGFSMQTIDKMFPKAEIYLDGNTQTINASGNANVAQTISGNIDQSRHASGCTNTLDKILTRVLDHDEFNAEEKVKFMKFLKAIEEVE
jgi:CRISPR/Cas system CSM-associated protein Csm2 small subunit